MYHETPSRAASTWYVLPLAPWRPFGYRTRRDDHIDRDTVKVEGSEQVLGAVSYMLVSEQRDRQGLTLVSGSTSRPVAEVSRAEVSGT